MDLARCRAILIRYSAVLLGVLLASLVTLEFVQVIFRYVFAYSFYWANEITLLLFLSLGWLGAAHLWIVNDHIELGLFDKLKKPHRLLIKLAADLIAVAGVIYLFPMFIRTLRIYSNIELASLPFSAAINFVPPLACVVVIGTNAVINLSSSLKHRITRSRT